LPEILRDFIQKIVVGFGESAMARSRKPFCCDECGNDKGFIWKTRHGKETRILTVFQWVRLEQLQVQCKRCGHKMYIVAAYCRDVGLVLRELRRVCKPEAHMCWVIGDSAPCGVYCPTEEWIAKMATASGFERYHFDKLRDRNMKWKNRKHRVPLKEGLLWIEG
ncbi:MAG: hypothetical protein B6D35_13080, partial [Candidatus Brocadia sp. UTAMX2]